MSTETPVKVVIWDLDGTVWPDTLATLPRAARVRARASVAEAMSWLDRHGVLQSVVSRNDHGHAMEQLVGNGLDHLLLYPVITFDDAPKSAWVRQIAEQLNIGLPDIVVIDDQRFERDQIHHALPEVDTIDIADLDTALTGPRFHFPHLTDEDRNRRALYLADAQRTQAQRAHQAADGPDGAADMDAYLLGEGLRLRITAATEDDLWRAATLTVRTHQLNATGIPYSHAELAALRDDPRHLLLTASLTDRHGDYGTIGIALLGLDREHWHLRLLLTSCRVMSRRVGTIMLNEIMARAKGAGMRTMLADFVDIEHGRNRTMMLTYAIAGFAPHRRDGEVHVLTCDLSHIQPAPAWMSVEWQA